MTTPINDATYSSLRIAERVMPHLQNVSDKMIQEQAINSLIRFFLDTDLLETTQHVKKTKIKRLPTDATADTSVWIINHANYHFSKVLRMYQKDDENLGRLLPNTVYTNVVLMNEDQHFIEVLPEFKDLEDVVVNFTMVPRFPDIPNAKKEFEIFFPKSIADKYNDILIAKICADLIGYTIVDNAWETRYREGVKRVRADARKQYRYPEPGMFDNGGASFQTEYVNRMPSKWGNSEEIYNPDYSS